MARTVAVGAASVRIAADAPGPRPVLGQHLDSHASFQRGIAGTIHVSHAACTQRRDDLIGTQPGADSQLHRWAGLYPERRSFTGLPKGGFSVSPGVGCAAAVSTVAQIVS